MNELIIAVPSKGRLEEKASALFRDAGLALIRPMRGYEGRIKGLDKTRVLYLSAGEIATRLLAGDVHLGITGEDLLREKSADMESSVSLLHPLGFGKASVVIGIPDEWADITTMDDLAEMAVDFRKKHNRPIRIATKYRRLTGDFLSNHGVYDAVTEYSDGATEGAPASGAAEAIVDITSTGETLKANGLRILKDGLLLESEANLVASLGAAWEEIPLLQAKALLTQLEARLRAPRYYKMQLIVYGTAGYGAGTQYDIGINYKEEVEKFTNKYGAHYIGQNKFLVPKNEGSIHEICEALLKRFACDAIIQEPEQVMIYKQNNLFFSRLLSGLEDAL